MMIDGSSRTLPLRMLGHAMKSVDAARSAAEPSVAVGAKRPGIEAWRFTRHELREKQGGARRRLESRHLVSSGQRPEARAVKVL